MDYLVSVIIPCYNVEKYIDRCLESVVGQTYRNLEIILIDDGSTDNTPALCDTWAEKDIRISVIHKKNKGVTAARNTGIKASKGDYLIFVDSDDYTELDIVDYLLKLSLENSADVARCGYYYDFDDGICKEYSKYDEKILLDYNERLIDLISGDYLSGVLWNKIYKRSVVSQFDESFTCSEDLMFNFSIYKDDIRVVCCDIPKYHYVENGSSITHSKFGYGAFDIIRARNIMLEYFKDDANILPYAQEWYIRSAFIVLSGCIRNNACMDRYDELRDGILEYTSFIFHSSQFDKKMKLRAFLLKCFPSLYRYILRSKGI